MTAIPGYTDEQIEATLGLLEAPPGRHLDAVEAAVAIDAIRQCQLRDYIVNDDGYIYAPTPQQIIDHLAVGGTVEQQTWYEGEWVSAPVAHGHLRRWRGESEPRRGFRLAPIKPRTKKVPILDALGRKNPATGARFDKITASFDPLGFWIYSGTAGKFAKRTGWDDVTVEVAIEDEP